MSTSIYVNYAIFLQKIDNKNIIHLKTYISIAVYKSTVCIPVKSDIQLNIAVVRTEVSWQFGTAPESFFEMLNRF